MKIMATKDCKKIKIINEESSEEDEEIGEGTKRKPNKKKIIIEE